MIFCEVPLGLFVCNHHALRFSAACSDEVDAVLVLGSRNDYLRFLGEERLNLLTQCVVDAYYAKVFALKSYALIGRVGEQG